MGSVAISTGEVGAVGDKLKVTQAEVGVVLGSLFSPVGIVMSPGAQVGVGALILWRKRCYRPTWLACPSALTQV